MGFAENYTRSVNAKSLQDDELHHATEALFAAAMADKSGHHAGLGSLLSRVKYADGTPSKLFESGTQNLARLLAIWTAIVVQKGRARCWIKIRNEWDLLAVETLYWRVAHASLAHWLGGRCLTCHGAGQTVTRRLCVVCKGSGASEIIGGRFETDRTLEMYADLDGLVRAHNDRANGRMGKK